MELILERSTVETTSSKILLAIRQRAIDKWGEDKWLANLVREYVRIEGAGASPAQRRPQIGRAFDTGGCTLETATLLAAAVGCKFQMICGELIDF